MKGVPRKHLRAEEQATGRAVDGPYDGTELARANDLPPMFWTGWVNFYPECTVYMQDGVQTPEAPGN